MSAPAKTTLQDRPLPAWFDDAKLGIFIHWGMFSVPGWAPVSEDEDDRIPPWTESYQYSMSVLDSPTARYHAQTYGDLPYEAFADRFRALLARWNPEAWADLFARAGARYVVLTTKVEDGFLMWPSERPSPFKEHWHVDRDVVGELAAAVRARGMEFGTYYSGWDWVFVDEEGAHTPAQWLELIERYGTIARGASWATHVSEQWRELIERYHPAVLWADYALPDTEDWEELIAWYYERVPDGVVNNRLSAGDENLKRVPTWHDFGTFESIVHRGLDYTHAPDDRKWEACRSMGRSWGYNRRETEEHYPTSAELVRELVDIVARGGNLLLNVGPTGAGEVPWNQAMRLIDIGWWLERHGAAIYGTRRWERPTGVTGDGLDVRYTASDDAVHAIVLGTPTNASPTNPRVELDVRLEAGAEVSIEDRPVLLSWTSTEHGVEIDLPEPPDEQPAIAFRLTPRESVRSSPHAE